MKLFTNLPGSLRALFGVLRFVTVLLGAFWFLTGTFNGWIAKRFTDNPKLMASVGEISLPTGAKAEISSDSAKPGALALVGLRGALQMDLLSQDADLVSALRWTMFPSMAVFVAFSWLLFGSLRTVCSNIERGEVFTESTLRLVRNIGLILIGYSVTGLALQLWAQHMMGGYLNQHVTLTGPWSGVSGALHFSLSAQFGSWSDFVTGCLVLVVSEAFRQGLALKTENDLTV